MRISDWSSDVCSSDLRIDIRAKFAAPYAFSDDRPPRRRDRLDETDADLARGFGRSLAQQLLQQAMKIGTLEIGLDQSLDMRHDLQIGRASCRERVWQYV